MAQSIEADINKQWNAGSSTYEISGNKYAVKFDVTVKAVDAKPENVGRGNNAIEISRDNQRSYVSTNIFGQSGQWSANDPQGAHEFGHLIGLADRYTDTSQGSQPNAGWQGNIMAQRGGSVEQKNIDTALKGPSIWHRIASSIEKGRSFLGLSNNEPRQTERYIEPRIGLLLGGPKK